MEDLFDGFVEVRINGWPTDSICVGCTKLTIFLKFVISIFGTLFAKAVGKMRYLEFVVGRRQRRNVRLQIAVARDCVCLLFGTFVLF